jgi:hypothetical protein
VGPLWDYGTRYFDICAHCACARFVMLRATVWMRKGREGGEGEGEGEGEGREEGGGRREEGIERGRGIGESEVGV